MADKEDQEIKQMLNSMLKDIEKVLPDVLGKVKEVQNAHQIEHEAKNMAKPVVEQFKSLTFEEWGKLSPPRALDNIEKVLGDDIDNFVKYGKAVGIARYNVEHALDRITKRWFVRVLCFFSKDKREKTKQLREAYINGVTFMMMRKIQDDIKERFEVRNAKQPSEAKQD